MRKINGADFYTARELAKILGYDEVQIGAFGVFCTKEKEERPMSKLEGLAFLLCARGKDEGLTDEEILWLVDGQIQRIEVTEYDTE